MATKPVKPSSKPQAKKPGAPSSTPSKAKPGVTAKAAPGQTSSFEDVAKAEALEKFGMVAPLQASFNPENIKRFFKGEMTLAQIMGVTLDEAYALAEYAYTMFEQGRTREARQIVESLVVQNPKDAYLHTLLGAIYWKLDMPEEAVEEYGYAIEMDPNNIPALTNRGEILLQHGEMDTALDDLKAAIELDPAGKHPSAARARALATATVEVMKILLKKA
jgi:tetratricopeptide (TPR) repeat protein